MNRQQRKDARQQQPSPTHAYSAVRAVACKQVGMDYRKVTVTPAATPENARAEKSWEMTHPSALGQLFPDAGVYPFPGQTRANGRPL